MVRSKVRMCVERRALWHTRSHRGVGSEAARHVWEFFRSRDAEIKPCGHPFL